MDGGTGEKKKEKRRERERGGEVGGLGLNSPTLSRRGYTRGTSQDFLGSFKGPWDLNARVVYVCARARVPVRGVPGKHKNRATTYISLAETDDPFGRRMPEIKSRNPCTPGTAVLPAQGLARLSHCATGERRGGAGGGGGKDRAYGRVPHRRNRMKAAPEHRRTEKTRTRGGARE